MGNLTNFTLFLGDNMIENIKYLAKGIKLLNSLTKLELCLSNNMLEKDCNNILYLGEGLKSLKNLRYLNINLKNKQLYSYYLENFGQNLEVLTFLKTLDLDIGKNNLCLNFNWLKLIRNSL